MASITLNTFLEILGFCGGLVAVYVALSNRVTKMEVRQDNHEKQTNEIKTGIDSIQETVNNIRITLENKVNR